jgi:hypothetical protein
MANTTVEFKALSALTLTLKLYPHGSDTIANGSGDSCTERTNCKGVYTATVTESLAGWHDAFVEDDSSNVIANYDVHLTDDTGTYRCGDRPHYLHDKVDAMSELSQGVPSATPSAWDALMLLYMAMRNKLTTTADEYAVYDDSGTKIAKKALSDDGVTFSEDEMISGA